MEADLDFAEFGTPKAALNPAYHLDRRKELGRINPYSEAAKRLLPEDERIYLQRLWCSATRAVPVGPKECKPQRAGSVKHVERREISMNSSSMHN